MNTFYMKAEAGRIRKTSASEWEYGTFVFYKKDTYVFVGVDGSVFNGRPYDVKMIPEYGMTRITNANWNGPN
jgi:hypothetical protein